MAAPWQKRASLGSILQIGIFRITKCAINNGFCKSSHICKPPLIDIGIYLNRHNYLNMTPTDKHFKSQCLSLV